MTLPATRKPRLLWTRADTIPVNARRPASAGCATATSGSWELVRGSSAECEGVQAARLNVAAQAPPARARVLIRTIIVLPTNNLIDNFQDISPSPTQRPECSHRRPGRIGACLRELTLGGEQLAIRVENIRQRDHPAL